MYRELKATVDLKHCQLCKKELEGKDSPWSICYDPAYAINCWGGDSHEYKALLCQECVEPIFQPTEGE